MKTNIYGQGKNFYLFMTVNLDFSNKKTYFGHRLDSTQQAHDVENTLAFNCVFVATSDNVMATSNRRQTPTSYLSQIFDVELRLLIEWKWKFF